MAFTRKSIPSSARLLGFAAAMEHCNFTRAAQTLCVTQAAVSRQIRELETELGVCLFERHARDVKPTPAAVRLAAAVLPGLEAIGEAVESIRRLEADQNQLIIYTDHSIANCFVLPKVTSFETEYPRCKVLIVSTNAALASYEEHFDLAVQYGFPPGKTFSSRQIAHERIFPVASPETAEQLPSPLSLEALADAPLIEFAQTSQRWISWADFFAHFGVDVRKSPRVRFDSYLGAIDAALSSQGILLGWQMPIDEHVRKKLLVRLGEWELEEPGGLRVHRRRNSGASPMVDRMERWLIRP